MDLFRLTCQQGRELNLDLWANAVEDLDSFMDIVQEVFPFCLVSVSDNPVPENVWTADDKEEWRQISSNPKLWMRFNLGRVEAALESLTLIEDTARV
jgi:hypothetical protein